MWTIGPDSGSSGEEAILGRGDSAARQRPENCGTRQHWSRGASTWSESTGVDGKHLRHEERAKGVQITSGGEEYTYTEIFFLQLLRYKLLLGAAAAAAVLCGQPRRYIRPVLREEMWQSEMGVFGSVRECKMLKGCSNWNY